MDNKPYNYDIVKWFMVMACFYLVIGTGVGGWIASELAWPVLNFDNPYISFGRLRPVHTNLVIFAFGGYTLMATAYYTHLNSRSPEKPSSGRPFIGATLEFV